MKLIFQKIFTIIIASFIGLNVFGQQLPPKSEILSKMKLVNEYWISQNPNPGNNQWARAVYFAGNTEFYKMYKKSLYHQYSTLWANNSGWGLNGGSLTRNADNQTCGQTYIDLYQLDSEKQENKIAAIKTSIDNMVNSAKKDDWWWIDAMFMSMPVFTRFGVMNNDSVYFEKMYKLYKHTKDTLGLYNSSKGLWYRDVNFKPPYATKNGEDSFWSRGNGWVFGAHARVLELLPQNNSHRAEFIQTFQEMAAALKLRQRSDGFWNPSLEDPNEFTGPETSGTAFFTYGLAWGINNNLLDSATYYPVLLSAWNGLTSTAVQSNGFLGYVQGVGAAPAFAPITSTQDFGVGAFLLAGTEILKLTSGEMPVPSNFFTTGMKVVDENHISVKFSKKIDNLTSLKPENYAINNGVNVISVSKSNNDSTVILSIISLSLGAYQLQVSNVVSSDGSQMDSSETLSFSYSNIVAVTASGFQSGTSNTPDKTLDFDFSTRWSCDGAGQWIMYDLGEVKLVNSVDVAFFSGNTRKAFFSINLSETLTDSVQVFDGASSGKSANLENYDFTDQKARYVKIIGYGNSQSTWNSITETRINCTSLNSGVKNTTQNSLKIYPNPIKGNSFKISVENTSQAYVTIKDLTGKILFDKNVQPVNSEINISGLSLSKGIYFVSVSSNNVQRTSLLISE